MTYLISVFSVYTKLETVSGGCSEFRLMNVLKDTAYPVGRQDRHFYFRLFLLSRKASNATIKLPKDISNANIPMKIEMIS